VFTFANNINRFGVLRCCKTNDVSEEQPEWHATICDWAYIVYSSPKRRVSEIMSLPHHRRSVIASFHAWKKFDHHFDDDVDVCVTKHLEKDNIGKRS
jgi:hypothetical protein